MASSRARSSIICVTCVAILAVAGIDVGRAGLVETPICGPVSGVLPLSGSPYRATCTLTVASAQTLTIEAGVELRFQTGTEMQVAGTLNAFGSGGAPIVFTSADPGLWGGIRSSGGTIQVANGVVENATIGVLFLDNATGGLVDTQLRFNAYPVGISDSFPILEGLTATGSIVAEAILLGTPTAPDDWSIAGTLPSAGLPYACLAQLEFLPGADLVIEPGVIVKSRDGALVFRGSLYAVGTDEEPIVFTSFLDDTVGGDTNVDGAATAPGADWFGLL